MGDMGLELPFEGFIVFHVPFVGIYLQVYGCCLRPGEYLNDANWRQLGEIDVTPKAGMVECCLAPSTTDTRNICPRQNAGSFVPCEDGQKGEYGGKDFRRKT